MRKCNKDCFHCPYPDCISAAHFSKLIGAPPKAVIAISKDGMKKKFKSITEASNKTGARKAAICCICKGIAGYKTAGGYRWRYAEEK